MVKTTNPAIDALRVLAILAVVLIHTTIKIIQAGGGDIVKYSGTLFLHQVAGFAVPLFFMLSGFVLELNYRPGILTFYRKRLTKLVIPLFFWSLIYFYLIYPGGTNFLWAFITGGASYQLYFVPTLIIYYLLFPLFRLIPAKWLIVLFPIQFYLLYQDYFVTTLPFILPIRIAYLGFFSFILGIFAARHEPRLLTLAKKFKFLLLALIIFFAGYIFHEGQTGNYYSQWRPSVMLYSFSLASLLYYHFTKLNLPTPLIHALSKLSFFVFFVHVIILEFVSKSINSSNNLVLFSLVTGISFLIAFLAHQVPRLSKLTG